MLAADVDAELGLITCVCLVSDRPDGQTVPPHSGVAHGFSLIPVSGVGGVVDDGKTGGKSRELRTILERHTESLKHLEPTHVHWMKCDTQRQKMCYLYTSRVFLASFCQSCLTSEGTARGASSPARPALYMPLSLPTT